MLWHCWLGKTKNIPDTSIYYFPLAYCVNFNKIQYLSWHLPSPCILHWWLSSTLSTTCDRIFYCMALYCTERKLIVMVSSNFSIGNCYCSHVVFLEFCFCIACSESWKHWLLTSLIWRTPRQFLKWSLQTQGKLHCFLSFRISWIIQHASITGCSLFKK